jgi:hypothetical protein
MTGNSDGAADCRRRSAIREQQRAHALLSERERTGGYWPGISYPLFGALRSVLHHIHEAQVQPGTLAKTSRSGARKAPALQQGGATCDVA